MRYTLQDYDAAIALLYHSGPRGPDLAPSERRLLAQLRAAYAMQADVPLSEVKLARQLIAAADIVAARQEIEEG